MTEQSAAWLAKLKTANADNLPDVLETLRNRDKDGRGLEIQTKLDALVENGSGLSKEDTDGKPLQAVLVIAHAGDGKSHFFQQVKRTRIADRDTYEFEPTLLSSSPPRFPPGLHIFNDPSQTEPAHVANYLRHAFTPRKPNPDARFLVGISRGKLRDVLALIDDDDRACTWLQSALEFEEHAHYVDDSGRLSIPLDRRVLVPTPGEKFAKKESRSPVGKLAQRILRWAQRDTGREVPLESAGRPERVWSRRIEVVLALVEANGHHVTFREALALTADVAEALADANCDADRRRNNALARLFQYERKLTPLEDISSLLRRLDPARLSAPGHELDEKKDVIGRPQRDGRLRREGLEKLIELFSTPAKAASDIPIRNRSVPYSVAQAQVGSREGAGLPVLKARRLS